MMRIFSAKEAIEKALKSNEQVEMKMRAVSFKMRRDGEGLLIECYGLKANGFKLEQEKLDEMRCKCDIGASAIAQLIDMKHRQLRPQAVKMCTDAIQSFREMADLCMLSAKEAERMLKGKE